MAEPTTATQHDLAAILRLNRCHEAQTSALDLPALARLIGQAFCALAVDAGQTAVLIALDQTAAYDSVNFLWFRARFDRFVSIDRVIVAGRARGRGVGRLLYDRLFAEAAAAGHTRVACEVSMIPPNPGSDAFHAATGFGEIGRATIHGGAKTVRYLIRDGALR